MGIDLDVRGNSAGGGDCFFLLEKKQKTRGLEVTLLTVKLGFSSFKNQEIILEQECVLLASGEIGLETSGDGQLAPDIFFES